ncbi:MAG: hypothetical protein DWQ07_17410 [Chloroflexi bacterium]|nr:MAG: hypothetical protein DWQ07_17410 [Chloroflexota bacterium]MBL1195184.1 hypothetical protein [Chloroflexota bacterium]NOH12468.1 Flp pilus assembly complex ATPase component TadA [Chloroflexota bacterium]
MTSNDNSKSDLPSTGTSVFADFSDVVGKKKYDEISTFRVLLKKCREELQEALTKTEQVEVRTDPKISEKAMTIIFELISGQEEHYELNPGLEYAWPNDTAEGLSKRIYSMLYGLGPIDRLLEREDVEDIAINGPHEVQIRTSAGWETAPAKDVQDLKVDPKDVIFMFNQDILKTGQAAGLLNPIVDAELSSGHRLSIVTEPAAADGVYPLVVIRRHRLTTFDINDFLYAPVHIPPPKSYEVPDYYTQWEEVVDEFPSDTMSLLTPSVATFLHMAVISGLNILLLGQTGVGKTAFLNMCGKFIPTDRRVLVVEETRELDLRPGDLPQGCVYIQTIQERMEGGVHIDFQDIIRAALRQRPDHLILGEARGGEFWELLNAMETGHGGNLTSMHANNIPRLISRARNMVGQAGEDVLPADLAQMLSDNFHIVITYKKDFRGRRFIKEMGRLTGELRGSIPDVEYYFEGGPKNDFRLALATKTASLEEEFNMNGFSFDQIVEIANKEEALIARGREV